MVLTSIASAIALLGLVACGDGGEPSSEAPPAAEATTGEDTAPAEESRCERVPRPLVRAIAEGLTVDGGGSLRQAWAVKSNDFESVYYVSADVQGPGLNGSGDIGTWATNSLSVGEGLILAADAVAREFSTWGADVGEGSEVADVMSMDNDGAEESRECLGQKRREAP